MAAKYYKDRKRINMSHKEEENYKSYIKDDIDLNQANNKYLLQK